MAGGKSTQKPSMLVLGYLDRASQFFITTEGAEDTENGHFMDNYGVFSVSSASSLVKNILLIISVVYQKHCCALVFGFLS